MAIPKATPEDTHQFLSMAVTTGSGQVAGKPAKLVLLDTLTAQTGKPDRIVRLAMTDQQFQQFADQVSAAAARIRSGQPPAPNPRPPGSTH